VTLIGLLIRNASDPAHHVGLRDDRLIETSTQIASDRGADRLPGRDT
jgi:hypothetical protein